MHTRLTVFRKRDIDDTTFELVLKRENIQFLPGDCMLFHSGERQITPYFIASGIQEPTVRFIINKKPSDFVDYLYSLHHGKSVRVDPVPKSCMPDLIKAQSPVFIAESHGISPVLSYMSSFPDKNGIKLYYPGKVNIDYLTKKHNVVTDIHDLDLNKKTNVFLFASQTLKDDIISSTGVATRRLHSYIIEP